MLLKRGVLFRGCNQGQKVCPAVAGCQECYFSSHTVYKRHCPGDHLFIRAHEALISRVFGDTFNAHTKVQGQLFLQYILFEQLPH